MFRDISIDKQHAAKLEVFDIVLGSLYMACFVVELFGLAAALMVRYTTNFPTVDDNEY